MKQIKTKHRIVGICLFFAYLGLLSYFLFFAEELGRTEMTDKYRYNLVLFKEIRRFWRYRKTVGMGAFFLNTFGNVIAFIPFGFFAPFVIRERHRGLYVTVLYGILFSLLIEFTQYMTGTGIFDVDDIFLNACGVLVGYLFLLLFFFLVRKRSGTSSGQR